MISVTRLDGEVVVVNAALIEFIETTPDTVLCMATGKRFMVLESSEEVVNRIVAYQQRVGHSLVVTPLLEAEDEDD